MTDTAQHLTSLFDLVSKMDDGYLLANDNHQADAGAMMLAIIDAGRRRAREVYTAAGPLAPLLGLLGAPDITEDDAVGSIVFGEFSAVVENAPSLQPLLDDIIRAYNAAYTSELRLVLDPVRYDAHLPF